MYVCLCKAITDSEIRQAVEDGAGTFREIRENLGVGTVCGSCACAAKKLLKANASKIDDGASAAFYQVA